MDDHDTILVVTGSSTTRGGNLRELKVEELSVNVTLFLEQMDRVLSKTPERLGEFQFVEFEVSAEVTAKGMLAILGTGGEAGATGGLKFVFRRAKTTES
ncbi:MAG: hypothetical protein BroJett039_06760 [Chloroflexota bacterium]|nr:MAG: hypothetical protein BroJett039_06760 [Chloroflexota bacterium]